MATHPRHQSQHVDIQRARSIPDHSRKIVRGFIKRLQVTHVRDDSYPIPNLVVTLCLLFYHETAIFCRHGEYMELSEDGKTVTMTNAYAQSCYCYSINTIPICKYRETTIELRIDNVCVSGNNVIVGVATSDETVDGAKYFKGNMYGYCGEKSMNQYLQTGDRVTIIISRDAIQFAVNGEKKKDILYFDRKGAFKVVVAMWNQGTRVSLVSIYSQDMQKETHCCVL